MFLNAVLCFTATFGGDENLQRWYPTFPHGLPSFGLLFLRAAIGVRLMLEGARCVLDAHGANFETWALGAVAAGVGICFVIGFLTPLAAGVSAVAEAAVYLWHPTWAAVFLGFLTFDTIVVTIAIVLLGPGSISLDAHFFGRRKIVISRAGRA
jgi:uncharacterized membrane protein YphA (DoxX/SURF4 family)